MEAIEPFHVMRLLSRARQMEAQGRHVVHMEIGEPDFSTPEPIVRAGQAALAAGKTHYTPALGLPELRQCIANSYQQRYGITVSADRIVVTPGASGALQLLFSVLVDVGNKVLLTDPGYPCNRHMIQLVEGIPVSVPVDGSSNFQLTPDAIAQHWDKDTVAALVASPSNPTGTLIDAGGLQGLYKAVSERGGVLLVDEIYHGLTYDVDAVTALSVSDSVFVINSFSKYFGMTGWRLGWLVAPEDVVPVLDRLAQNLFLAAPTTAQYAALAAFDDETLLITEERRAVFQARRDYLMPALRDLGFEISAPPQGAFYIYARCTGVWADIATDSFELSGQLLEELGVAVTPGLDFGTHRAGEYLRFAYTTGLDELMLGIERLKGFVPNKF